MLGPNLYCSKVSTLIHISHLILCIFKVTSKVKVMIGQCSATCEPITLRCSWLTGKQGVEFRRVVFEWTETAEWLACD